MTSCAHSLIHGIPCPRQVTYKMLMNHWFAKCAQLASEADRIAALDDIPPAIRRANPNMTKEFYLRYRAQPFFLLNTTDVCSEADEQLCTLAYDELTPNLGGSELCNKQCYLQGGSR